MSEVCLVLIGDRLYSCRSDGDVRRRPRLELLPQANVRRRSERACMCQMRGQLSGYV